MSAEWNRRQLLVGAAALSLATTSTHAQLGVQPPPKQPPAEALTPAAPVSIEVKARPIGSFDLRDRSRIRFGELQFRSGLVLTSSFRGFGGLSALRLDKSGERFVALNDKATWFTGRIVYRGGEMTGVTEVEAAPILGPDGRPITLGRRWYDTESLALDGGVAYVGLERVHQIMKFDFGRDGVLARGEVVPQLPAMRKLPSNKGVEALVAIPKGRPLAGTLLAISERGLDADGNIKGFMIGGKTPAGFTIRRTEDFDISDAALLPGGDLLVLERKFSFLTGAGIRIRRLSLKALAPGALLDGRSIFEADLGHEIDNLEGLDVHLDARGNTVLTLVSDDNFSMIQRNLLLQFTLIED
uniref:Phytase-like domain-containing protein n=1 Tax=Rhodopseudomonas palustris (strain BisA53) TaxID=316055 RepID=Q07VE2_RHOP5